MSGNSSGIERAAKLKLEDYDIDRMLDEDIERTLAALKRWETGKSFDELPEEIQQALLDMAFNLGPGKLKTEFRKLKKQSPPRIGCARQKNLADAVRSPRAMPGPRTCSSALRDDESLRH